MFHIILIKYSGNNHALVGPVPTFSLLLFDFLKFNISLREQWSASYLTPPNRVINLIVIFEPALSASEWPRRVRYVLIHIISEQKMLHHSSDRQEASTHIDGSTTDEGHRLYCYQTYISWWYILIIYSTYWLRDVKVK